MNIFRPTIVKLACIIEYTYKISIQPIETMSCVGIIPRMSSFSTYEVHYFVFPFSRSLKENIHKCWVMKLSSNIWAASGEKHCRFWPGLTQIRLYSHWRWPEAWNFVFRKWRYCTIQVAKTKTLISFAVTAKLICVFVFTYAQRWFSHDEAHMIYILSWCTVLLQLLRKLMELINIFLKA